MGSPLFKSLDSTGLMVVSNPWKKSFQGLETVDAAGCPELIEQGLRVFG